MEVKPDNPKVMVHRSYKSKEKQNEVNQIKEFVSSGWSQFKACITIKIPYLYYCHWKNLIKKVDGINNSNVFVPYNTKDSSL